MRALTLECDATTFKTEVMFVDKGEEWSWERVMKRVGEQAKEKHDKRGEDLKRWYGPTVALPNGSWVTAQMANCAYRMLGRGECIETFVHSLLTYVLLEKEMEGATRYRTAPERTGLEGWVNGRRGGVWYPVDDKKMTTYFSPAMSMKPIKKLALEYAWGPDMVAKVLALNGPKGSRTRVKVEEWPAVAAVWGHDREVVGRHWTIAAPGPTVQKLARGLRQEKKNERIDVSSLCWGVLNAVPEEIRCAALRNALKTGKVVGVYA